MRPRLEGACRLAALLSAAALAAAPPAAADLEVSVQFAQFAPSTIDVLPGETLGYGCTFEAPREMLVATLPIGYNDGYVRPLSNRGRVIVRGHYASVVGRISMDLTLVDVTDVPGVALDDCVTLLGMDGELSITAEEIAKTVGTLS